MLGKAEAGHATLTAKIVILVLWSFRLFLQEMWCALCHMSVNQQFIFRIECVSTDICITVREITVEILSSDSRVRMLLFLILALWTEMLLDAHMKIPCISSVCIILFLGLI